MKWTKEQYDFWCDLWKRNNPNKTPPNFNEFLQLIEMFGFTFEELTIGR